MGRRMAVIIVWLITEVKVHWIVSTLYLERGLNSFKWKHYYHGWTDLKLAFCIVILRRIMSHDRTQKSNLCVNLVLIFTPCKILDKENASYSQKIVQLVQRWAILMQKLTYCWFDPRLHHKKRSMSATLSFFMWDNKDKILFVVLKKWKFEHKNARIHSLFSQGT
jgi:hypothetical protein